jgi:hypothetical protein
LSSRRFDSPSTPGRKEARNVTQTGASNYDEGRTVKEGMKEGTKREEVKEGRNQKEGD